MCLLSIKSKHNHNSGISRNMQNSFRQLLSRKSATLLSSLHFYALRWEFSVQASVIRVAIPIFCFVSNNLPG